MRGAGQSVGNGLQGGVGAQKRIRVPMKRQRHLASSDLERGFPSALHHEVVKGEGFARRFLRVDTLQGEAMRGAFMLDPRRELRRGLRPLHRGHRYQSFTPIAPVTAGRLSRWSAVWSWPNCVPPLFAEFGVQLAGLLRRRRAGPGREREGPAPSLVLELYGPTSNAAGLTGAGVAVVEDAARPVRIAAGREEGITGAAWTVLGHMSIGARERRGVNLNWRMPVLSAFRPGGCPLNRL